MPRYIRKPVTKELIADFEAWTRLTTRPDTAESYASTIAKYCIHQEIGMINRKDFFVELKDSLIARGLGLNTVMRHTFAVKKFLLFLNEKYDIAIINLDVIRCKKPPRQTVTYLEKSEIEAIRSVPIGTLNGLRDRALFEFLLYTGCRISEALGIDWRKIDFKKGEVEVLGKGGKQRIVFLNDAKKWVLEYLANRGSDHASLFLSQYQRRQWTRGSAALAIRKLGKKGGLQKWVHPHLLRHTFGTYLIWSGVDPRTVQEMMGHDDLETTLRYYSAVTQERMREAHTNFGNFIGEQKLFSEPQKQGMRPWNKTSGDNFH